MKQLKNNERKAAARAFLRSMLTPDEQRFTPDAEKARKLAAETDAFYGKKPGSKAA